MLAFIVAIAGLTNLFVAFRKQSSTLGSRGFSRVRREFSVLVFFSRSWLVLNLIRIVRFLSSGYVWSLLQLFELDFVALCSSVVVACQRFDKFLFSFSADVADVTFEFIVRHDVDSYVVPQVFRARFLLGVCLQFLDRRFGFFNFLFQSRGAVSVIARSLVGDVVFPSFSVAALTVGRPLATFKIAI